MIRFLSLTFTACLASFLLFSCATPKEEIQDVKPEIRLEPAPPPEPERVFKYEERYFVKDAAIDEATNIDDPLQAVRVIQLKEGRNQVLVISSFEKISDAGVEVNTESWFGIELPSFAPDVYNVSDAVNTSFYRFYLGETGKRFDGKSYKGTIQIEEVKGGHITGYMNVLVEGVMKAFDQPSEPYMIKMSGSFKIKVVPVEATIMKKK